MKNKRKSFKKHLSLRGAAMKSFHLKKVGMLFLSGFVLGMILISMGWAAPAKKHPKHAPHKTPAHHSTHRTTRPVSRQHKKKTTAIVKKSQPVTHAKLAFNRYDNPEGLYKLRYPANWRVNAHDNAMVMKSSNRAGQPVVFGIVRRNESLPNEDALLKEFNSPNRPADMVRMPARVAGLPATKVIGSDKNNPDNRLVEYYVQHPNGREYYIMLMAPRNQWAHYASTFNTMLTTLSLN
jgi:hypothetical protein